MKGTKKIQKKEEIAEDWCFVCKDGGLLLVCDYKKCLKAYHPECVGKDESFLETGNHWTCNWHSCFICSRTPKFHCFCCPNAVCQRCITAAEFVHVRGKKGFCNNCLKLALLVEENVDVDSDGDMVDFKDRETYEFLFMEYWEIIKEQEGLTLENLHSADAQLKKGKSYMNDSDSDDSDKGEEEEEEEQISDCDNRADIEEHMPVCKRKGSMGKHSMKRKAKSKSEDFIGWGSKSLLQFLASIGKDTGQKLSQHDVASIINGYINENKLFHPEIKKKVICDARLQSFLGRKKVNRNRIHDLLEAHFSENLEQSEEDEFGYNSEDKDENALVACKRQRNLAADRKSQKKEVVFDAPESCFASFVAENIKLVYLKRSLVQELFRQPETFESKVTGSFVRVKSDPNDYFQRNSHQLAQVTGIKKTSGGENNTEILLQISNIPKDIRICMLSDDDFSEEECEDLRQKVNNGLLKRPTVVELEQKARSLHEDITKHWIVKELALLQNLIDRANEKGWRRELFEYLERRQLLQTSSEQSRLLQKAPKVIADVPQLEPFSEDNIKNDKQGDEGSPKSILMGSLEIPGDNKAGKTSLGDHVVINRKPSSGNIGSNDGDGSGKAINSNTAEKNTEEDKGHHSRVSTPKEKQHHTATSVLKELSQQSHVAAPKVQHDVFLEQVPHQSISGEKTTCSKASIIEELPQQSHILPLDNQCNVILQTEPHRSSFCIRDGEKNQPIDAKQKIKTNQEASAVALIELSSDDDDDESTDAIGKHKPEDPESCEWHCLGPNGERKGPYSMSLLKCWSETTTFALKFKVWKTGQSEESAVPLSDAIHLVFPGK